MVAVLEMKTNKISEIRSAYDITGDCWYIRLKIPCKGASSDKMVTVDKIIKLLFEADMVDEPSKSMPDGDGIFY